ncbi:MAG: pseudaminic acid synthase [Succinivibrio sp.]|nr:pseudaminic acid synthase [Succinivibrio sp.]
MSATRPEIVAELSGNHGGRLEQMLELMDLAAACGADAVKIQTYTEDSLTLDSKRPEFMITGGLWAGQSLYELYKLAKTPPEWMPTLFEHARQQGIALFSSPFSFADVEVLEQCGCPRYKIASFEVNFPELIALCAETHKPMVISTGLATLEEIDKTVELVQQHGCEDLTLLYCQSHYPADPKTFNLNTIPFFKERYGCKVGLSNHALGNTLDLVATALGAQMIEKHFTHSRKAHTVDGAFSMEPAELKELREQTEIAALCLGKKEVCLQSADLEARAGRRSVYLVRTLKAGQVLTRDCVRVVRPAGGLSPYELDRMLGRKALHEVQALEPLREEDFA